MSDYKKLSIFLCKILRHNPSLIDLDVSYDGAWANVDELIEKVNAKSKFYLNREILEEIVRTDNKTRYSFSADGAFIRCNQGHSFHVEMHFAEKEPPKYLWHGTSNDVFNSIMKDGLLPMSREYVHLSPNHGTAVVVGNRKVRKSKNNGLCILRIRAEEMSKDGYKFYISDNGVWQIKHVPPKYIEIYELNGQ